MKDLSELEEILRTPLNSEVGGLLAEQLVEVEAWSSIVAKRYGEAKAILSEVRAKSMLPNEKGTTVLDREVHLAYMTSDEQRAADYLKDLQETIKQRITLGQSILRNLRTEMESSLR